MVSKLMITLLILSLFGCVPDEPLGGGGSGATTVVTFDPVYGGFRVCHVGPYPVDDFCGG